MYCVCGPLQVQKVLGQFKDEGLIGLVNLIGDYQYVEMETLEGDDIMKMMQVCRALKMRFL